MRMQSFSANQKRGNFSCTLLLDKRHGVNYIFWDSSAAFNLYKNGVYLKSNSFLVNNSMVTDHFNFLKQKHETETKSHDAIVIPQFTTHVYQAKQKTNPSSMISFEDKLDHCLKKFSFRNIPTTV